VEPEQLSSKRSKKTFPSIDSSSVQVFGGRRGGAGAGAGGEGLTLLREPLDLYILRQGDRIGPIVACWVIDYFRQ
jgi:hypothetical protein